MSCTEATNVEAKEEPKTSGVKNEPKGSRVGDADKPYVMVSFNRWHGMNNSAAIRQQYNINTTNSGALGLYIYSTAAHQQNAWTTFKNQFSQIMAEGNKTALLDNFTQLAWDGQPVFYPLSAHGIKIFHIAISGSGYVLQRKENGSLVNVVSRNTLGEIIDYLEFIRQNGTEYHKLAVITMNISAENP
ncbi:MAG: hypothetical protein EAZ32_06260 [Cytophagia bacterium]|nr:MAG: hypothetical protein EAZ32_06260 [Cytophagia bacterium]